MPALTSHFMHKESHQGPHLGLLGVLNLEHVLKSWIASDLLFKNFYFMLKRTALNIHVLFTFYFIYNSKILSDHTSACTLNPYDHFI